MKLEVLAINKEENSGEHERKPNPERKFFNSLPSIQLFRERLSEKCARDNPAR